MTGRTPPRQPESGDVLIITRAASVQFADPMYFRVIRVPGWETYHGWLWLEGYELDSRGEAVERRHIFVQLEGLRWAQPRPAARPHHAARPLPAAQRQPPARNQRPPLPAPRGAGHNQR